MTKTPPAPRPGRTSAALLATTLCVASLLAPTRAAIVVPKPKMAVGKCTATEGTPSRWGHLYVDNGLERLEFFTADFSQRFPCGAMQFAIADPPEACAPLVGDYAGMAVLVERGTCSFQQKAEAVARAGALAMIVENVAEDGLFLMPAGLPSTDPNEDADLAGAPSAIPRGEDSEVERYHSIASVLIRPRAAQLLRLHFASQPQSKLIIEGEFSMYPDNTATNVLDTCGACRTGVTGLDAEAEAAERKVFLRKGRNGILSLRTAAGDEVYALDFFASFSGASLPDTRAGGVLVALPPAGSELACDEIPAEAVPGGSVLLVERGGCPFVDKLENALRAGARALLVVNGDSEISLPGVADNQLNPNGIAFREGSLLGSAMVFELAGKHAMGLLREDPSLMAYFNYTNVDLLALKLMSEDSGEIETNAGMLEFPRRHPGEYAHMVHQMNVQHKELAQEVLLPLFSSLPVQQEEQAVA